MWFVAWFAFWQPFVDQVIFCDETGITLHSFNGRFVWCEKGERAMLKQRFGRGMLFSLVAARNMKRHVAFLLVPCCVLS